MVLGFVIVAVDGAVVLMLVASLISLVLVRASRYDRMESVQEGL